MRFGRLLWEKPLPAAHLRASSEPAEGSKKTPVRAALVPEGGEAAAALRVVRARSRFCGSLLSSYYKCGVFFHRLAEVKGSGGGMGRSLQEF